MEYKNPAPTTNIIVEHENKILLLKRNTEPYLGKFALPGGFVDYDEQVEVAAVREVKEETGLDIEVIIPFNVNHFTRDDGQTITMLVYLCKALNETVTLSEEHPEYKWLTLENAKKEINEYFYSDIALLEKFELLKHL